MTLRKEDFYNTLEEDLNNRNYNWELLTNHPERLEQIEGEKEALDAKINEFTAAEVDGVDKEEVIAARGEAASLAERLSNIKDQNQTTSQEAQLQIAKLQKELTTARHALSMVNVNQEAKQAVEGGNVISLPKNTSEGTGQISLSGRTLTNLIKNGNLKEGLEGWTLEGIQESAYNEKAITYTIDRPYYQDNKSFVQANIVGEINAQDKYYVSVLIRRNNDVHNNQVVFHTDWYLFGAPENVIGEHFSKMSTIGQFEENHRNRIGVSIWTPSHEGINVTINEMQLYNLTQEFGAGNEPSKEWCDEHLADYIDGTKSVATPKRIKSVDKTGSKSSHLYLNNKVELRSLPNGVADEIRPVGKGGYELVKRSGEREVKKETVSYSYGIDDGKTVAFYFKVYNNQITYESTGIFKVGTYEFKLIDMSLINSSDVEGACYRSNDSFYVRVAKNKLNGTLPNSFDNWLKDKDLKIFTELTTPEIIPLSTSGNLTTYPSGTVYFENVIADAGMYTDKFTALHDFAIEEVDLLSKLAQDGTEVDLDVSKAVVDGNTFTHPDLSEWDIVFVEYYYVSEKPNGISSIEYYDSRYTLKDEVTDKFYKWDLSVIDGRPSIDLTEV